MISQSLSFRKDDVLFNRSLIRSPSKMQVANFEPQRCLSTMVLIVPTKGFCTKLQLGVFNHFKRKQLLAKGNSWTFPAPTIPEVEAIGLRDDLRRSIRLMRTSCGISASKFPFVVCSPHRGCRQYNCLCLEKKDHLLSAPVTILRPLTQIAFCSSSGRLTTLCPAGCCPQRAGLADAGSIIEKNSKKKTQENPYFTLNY